MSKFFVVILFNSVVLTSLAQSEGIPNLLALEYFKANVRIQQGVAMQERQDYELFLDEHVDLYGLSIYKFQYIDLFSIKEKLLVKVITDYKLYKDSALMHHLESYGIKEKNTLLDSLLKKYLRISGSDTLIKTYIKEHRGGDFYENRSSSCIRVGIIAYSSKNDAFYDLLGFKYNDFAVFLNTELLSNAILERYRKDEKKLKEELKKLNFFGLDLVEYYDYYVKSKTMLERYPIKFKVVAY